MTTRPNISAPLVNKDGRINRVWIDYLTRETKNLEPLEADATLAEVITKLNGIIAAFETAGFSKKD